MGGNRAYFTVLLVTLALMCAGIVGARWAVLAQRQPLKPLPSGIDFDAAANAAAVPAEDESQPADGAELDAMQTDPSAAAKPRSRQPEVEAANADRPGGTQTAVDSTQLKLDLNTASAVQLEELPGIGPALAKRILAYRKQHGRFRTVDELLEVEGIGAGKLKEIRELVYVNTAE